jgi:hypothetical protein
LAQLTEIVLATAQVREAPEEQLVRLPIGDGMALIFRNSSEEPARCALEIAEALKKHPEIPVRMGIHSGPVSEVTDASGRTNIAGAGIKLGIRCAATHALKNLSPRSRPRFKIECWGYRTAARSPA